jgi:hypothetical protein
MKEKEQANGKKRQVDQMNMNKMRTMKAFVFFFNFVKMNTKFVQIRSKIAELIGILFFLNFYTFIYRKTFLLIKIICKYLLINHTRVNYIIFLLENTAKYFCIN